MEDGIIGAIFGLIGLVGFVVIHGLMGLALWVVFALLLSLGGASDGVGSAIDSGGVGSFIAFAFALIGVLIVA